jgi:DNA-binding SARP family transcriptional activator
MVEISLFGDPHVRVDGATWSVRVTPACWTLLALLAVQKQPVLRATIAPLLWPDALDSEALANLRRHLHILTRALPPSGLPWVVADAKTIAWNRAADARIDVVEFQKMIAHGRDRDAVELYGGDLLSSSFDDAIVELRERFRAQYLDALERLVQRARIDHDFGSALYYAELLLAADEWREDTVRLAMTIKYEKGDRPGAIAVYERFAESLQRELRARPMSETRDLRDAILAGGALPQEAPKLRSVDRETGVGFVGRTAELQTLRNAWARAARGRGTTILLTGEPGIGKSRLALELSGFVEQQSGYAVIGRTASPEGCAFQPVIEALREGLSLLSPGDLDPEWIATLMTVLPEIERVSANGLPSLEAFDAERARVRLREALVRVISAMARRKPLVIVLEDVHWAGRDTLEFLEMLAHRVAGLPVLLVMTYRPGDLSAQHSLHAMRRELQHARRGQTLALPRLGEPELADLTRELLGGAAPTASIVKRLREVSEGNPLFAVQVLRYVAETGELPSAERALQSVAGTVVSRLDRLTPDARSIAEVAASIGSDFSIEEVARVGGWEEPKVLDALGVLLDAKIVCERGGERFAYGFTHALIEAAIRDALKGDRRLRHYRIAEVLSATRERDPAAAVLIAAHWEAAGELRRAAVASLRASRVAMNRYAWREAHELARRAVVDGLDDASKFEALSLVAEASFRLADPESALNEIAEMRRIAPSLGIDERAGTLLMTIRYGENTGERQTQKRAINKLKAIAQETGNVRWHAEAEFSRGKLLFLDGRQAESEGVIRAALDLARASGDTELVWRVREVLVQNLLRQGKIDEGKIEVDSIRTEVEAGSLRGREALAVGLVRVAVATQDRRDFQAAYDLTEQLASELGDVRSSLVWRNELSYYLHHNWNTAASRESYEAASALTKERGLLQLWMTSRVNLGCVEREVGHFDRARALWKEARLPAKRLNIYTTQACCALNLGELDFTLGEFANALKEARAGFEFAVKSGGRQLIAEAHSILGAIECANGKLDAGLARMRDGLERRRAASAPRWLAHELCQYIEVLVSTSKIEEAATAAVELRSLWEKDPDHQVYPGRIALALASVATAMGNDADARKLIDRGRRSVQFVLSRLTDPADREAFSALPHNKKLLE